MRKEDVTAELDFPRDDRFFYRMVGPMEAERLSQDTNFALFDRGRGGACFFFWVNQNPAAPWGKEYPRRMELFQKVEFRRRWLTRSTGTRSFGASSKVTPSRSMVRFLRSFAGLHRRRSCRK